MKSHTRLRDLLCLCLFLFASTSMAAQLQVQVKQHQLELGKPIWITLHSDQTAVSLDTLDFSAWRRQVALPLAYFVNRNRDNTAQVLRLRVYPYHTGELILPGLQFMHHTSAPLRFTILPARDPVTQAPMDFACTVSGRQAWQQQQVIIGCRLHLHDAYALLTQAAKRQADFRLLPMQVQRHTTGQGRSAQTRYQLGWVVYAARAGKQVLHLPPIEYVRDGVVTRRFYLAPLHLQVRALPAWLPGTIPVGQVSSTQYRLRHLWLSTGVLSQLQLRVRLSGVAPSLVPDYPAQLHSDRRFTFYRPQRQHQTRVLSSGVQHELDDSIPLVAHRIGLYRLPDLRLQYFDPVRGTLETRRLQGGTVMIVNGWIKAALGLLLAGVLVWLARRTWFTGAHYWQRFRRYQQALVILDAQSSHDVIRRGMRVMATAEGWRANLSYLQWQACMQRKSPLAKALPVAQLNAAVYGRGTVDLALCVEGLRRICRRRRLSLR